MSKPRILLAITVYNGRAFVPRALESAGRLSTEAADLDVLVLDDCSPEPGWSAELATICAASGVGYYRSPRNLGIVRNVNLGLLQALHGGYDFAIISNSDVIYPRTLVDELLAVYHANEGLGSITAFSNNASLYSLPNEDPDAELSDQETVDWLAASLAGEYAGHVLDVPAGISMAILIPTPVIEAVGLMDPIFGRGYCEETDWSLRSAALGYRVGLAPAAFVYHQGQGSTVDAGMLSGGHTTVTDNEFVIDMRYPLFRAQVAAFFKGGLLQQLHENATARIIADAGDQFGYQVDVAWFPRRGAADAVRVVVNPEWNHVHAHAQATFRGFSADIDLGDDPAAAIRQFFRGSTPEHVNLRERSPAGVAIADLLGAPVKHDEPGYPGRV
jgi:GT2 family glycosyltransferase